MRVIALEACAAIATLTFIAMLVTTAKHCAWHHGVPVRALIAEHVWASIPWIIVIAAALPTTASVVAVTTWLVPLAVFVVNETVAIPLPFVMVVGFAKLPPPVRLHVTT